MAYLQLLFFSGGRGGGGGEKCVTRDIYFKFIFFFQSNCYHILRPISYQQSTYIFAFLTTVRHIEKDTYRRQRTHLLCVYLDANFKTTWNMFPLYVHAEFIDDDNSLNFRLVDYANYYYRTVLFRYLRIFREQNSFNPSNR